MAQAAIHNAGTFVDLIAQHEKELAHFDSCIQALQTQVTELESGTHDDNLKELLANVIPDAAGSEAISVVLAACKERLAEPPNLSDVEDVEEEDEEEEEHGDEDYEEALSSPAGKKKKGGKDTSSFKRAALRIWRKVNGHRYSAIFRKPVNLKDAPGYKKVVKEPMDLSLIKKKVELGEVEDLDKLEQLFSLMCSNAMLFNGEGDDYYDYAKVLQEYCKQCVTEAQNSGIGSESDGDEEESEHPIKTTPSSTKSKQGAPRSSRRKAHEEGEEEEEEEESEAEVEEESEEEEDGGEESEGSSFDEPVKTRKRKAATGRRRGRTKRGGSASRGKTAVRKRARR